MIGRNIMLPDVKDFGQLFTRANLIKDLGQYRSQIVRAWFFLDKNLSGKTFTAVAECTSFCNVSGKGIRYSLDVSPTRDVLSIIENNMIMSDCYRYSFSVYIWNKREALVVCNYNLIIGSCYLAVVNPKTIPALARFKVEKTPLYAI